MQHKQIKPSVVIFWTLTITLLSGLSTTVFSETLINDGFGISLMILTSVGLLFTIAHIFLHALFEICNPSN